MVCKNACIQSECYCPLFTTHVFPGFQKFADQRQSSLGFLRLVMIECSHILEEYTAFIIPGDLTGSTWTLYNHISSFAFNNHVSLIHSTWKAVRMFLSNARTFTHYNTHNPQRITFHISFIFHTKPLLDAFAKFRKATISCVMPMSVCPTTWNNSAPTGRIFVNFDIWILFPISVAYSDRHAPSHYTQHVHPQYSIYCSSTKHLSEGTRNAPWGWQCDAETCGRYHT
jgi:hypothetical protein